MTEPLALLRSTRRITVAVTVLLGIQLSGNLYEEIVTNARAIADPEPGGLVGPLAAGSPLYFYLPWVPIGIVLTVVLAARLRRTGPAWIARRITLACGALAVAIAAKVYLIGWVNPLARDASVPAATVRAEAITWAFVNGVAIAAVATALVLVLSWRARVLDAAASSSPGLGHPGRGVGRR